MDVEPGRDTAVEVIKQCAKFLVAVARLTPGNHLAIQDIECGEQGGSAMAAVVVSYSFDVAQAHRQPLVGYVPVPEPDASRPPTAPVPGQAEFRHLLIVVSARAPRPQFVVQARPRHPVERY
jgi:hypothetical protein